VARGLWAGLHAFRFQSPGEEPRLRCVEVARSLLKRDWELSDYPLALREHEINPDYAGTRVKQHRYSVAIVNWWVMSGGGDTKREAMEELEKRFAAERSKRGKAGKPLPRPGTHVPIDLRHGNGSMLVLNLPRTSCGVFSISIGLGYPMSQASGTFIHPKIMES
jgi:hypothetical protein